MKKMTAFCMLIAAATFAGGCAKKTKMDASQAGVTPGATTAAQAGAEAGGAREQAVNENGSAAAGAGAAGTGAAAGLSTIYFDFDSYVLSELSRETLKQNYDWLKSRPEVRVTLEGHADERGSDQYNLSLGEKRARMAMDFLADLGLAGDRMSTISYGEEKPAVEGNDEGAWSKNRRVEFR